MSMTQALPQQRELVRDARVDTAKAGDTLPIPVIAYVIAVLIPIMVQVGPLNLSPLRLMLIIYTPFCLSILLSGRRGKLAATDVFFFLHVFWMAVAFAVVMPSRLIENIGSAALEFLGGYLIARVYITSSAQLVALIRLVGLVLLILLPFAIYESLTTRPIILDILSKVPTFSTVGNVLMESRMGLDRVQAVFPHPILFGLFSSLSFTFILIGLKGQISGLKRFVLLVVSGLCVFLSLSSGALLAVMIQIALIAWNRIFAFTQRRWLILCGLLVAMYIVVDLLSNRTPIEVFMSYATFSPWNAYWRATIFEWGMVNVWGSPIFGIALKDWVRPWWMWSSSVDNFWLVMAMRYGLPGLALVFAGFVAALIRIARAKITNDPLRQQLRLAAMITFAGLTFTLSTVHVWANIYSFVFFLLGAVMWIADDPGPKDTAPVPSEDPQAPSSRYTRFPAKHRRVENLSSEART